MSPFSQSLAQDRHVLGAVVIALGEVRLRPANRPHSARTPSLAQARDDVDAEAGRPEIESMVEAMRAHDRRPAGVSNRTEGVKLGCASVTAAQACHQG